MQKLFSFKQSSPSPPLRHHIATVTPPHHHRHGFTHHTTFPQPLQPTRQISHNVILKPKVPCKLFVDHGELRSTRVDFRRRNFLFNQSVSYHETCWQLHSTVRPAPADGVVKGLILTNVFVFLLWRVADKKFMMQNFMVQWDNFNSGRYHTMITHAFSHWSVLHILSNMIWLHIHGKSIVRRVGPGFFLKLYLVGAFVSAASFLVDRAFLASSSKDNQLCKPDRSKAAALGASGAVNAILMLDLLLSSTDSSVPDFIIPYPVLVALEVIYRIWLDIERIKEDSDTGGASHLGGAAVGIIAWAWLRIGGCKF